MYILTDYRLIRTKDTKDRPDLSSERTDPSGTVLARPAATVNYRLVLSSERALQNNKPQLSKRKSQGERKNWSWVPDGRLTPRRTGRVIVGRNVTLTLNDDGVWSYRWNAWQGKPKHSVKTCPSAALPTTNST
jgi:hypothetical protein